MTTDDIKHLGTLSRLSLTDAEATAFSNEIDAILAYVSQVTTIAGAGDLPKIVGPRHTIMRDDVVTNEPGAYTETLLSAAPVRTGQFFAVKKIIDQGS